MNLILTVRKNYAFLERVFKPLMTDQSKAFETVVDQAKRIHHLEKVDHMLRWDADVMMPEGGGPARSPQRSVVKSSMMNLLSSDTLADALESVDRTELDGEDRAIVREVKREHEVARRIPKELDSRLSQTLSDAHGAWKEAKQADDFNLFAPYLQEHVELRVEQASHVDPNAEPFEALWENQIGYLAQPYLEFETVERVFDELRDGLVPLIEQIRNSDIEHSSAALEGEFSTDKQVELNRHLLDTLGLDWDRARFDTAPHPFSYGTPYDVRMTTRLDANDLLPAISATLHEFGHTAYTHGLPNKRYGTPLSRARGLTVHGSQSGVWENHIGRSRAFWEMFLPKVKMIFPGLNGVTVEEAYQAANQVRADNLIRTNADEVTYHMHVILRTEIERDLVEGRIDVSEVAQVWNEKMEQYLGVRPDSDAEGPLQDPHWTQLMPAFINYTTGHGVLAAQVYAALEDDLGSVDQQIRNGEFDEIRSWLTENIHRHGQRYKTQELIERATGQELTAGPFLDYIENKYSDLYSI